MSYQTIQFLESWWRDAQFMSRANRGAFFEGLFGAIFDGTPEPADKSSPLYMGWWRGHNRRAKIEAGKASAAARGGVVQSAKRNAEQMDEQTTEQESEQNPEQSNEHPRAGNKKKIQYRERGRGERSRADLILDMTGDVPGIAEDLEAPEGFVDHFLAGMKAARWTAMRGDHVFDVTPENLPHIMRGWLKQFNAANDSQKKISGARVEPMTIDDIPIAR